MGSPGPLCGPRRPQPPVPSARGPVAPRGYGELAPTPHSRNPLPDGPGRAEPSYLRPGTCWPPCPPARPRSPSRAPPAAAAAAAAASASSAAASAAAASPRGGGEGGNEGRGKRRGGDAKGWGQVPAPSLGQARPSGPGQGRSERSRASRELGRGPVWGALMEVEGPRARVLTQGEACTRKCRPGALGELGGGKGSISPKPLPPHPAFPVTCPPPRRSSPPLPSLGGPVNVTSST